MIFRSKRHYLKMIRTHSQDMMSSWQTHLQEDQGDLTQKNVDLFSINHDIWKTTKPVIKRQHSSTSTFEEVESLCLSKSSSESLNGPRKSTPQGSVVDYSNTICPSTCRLVPDMKDVDTIKLHHQIPESVVQRVQKWNDANSLQESGNCSNWTPTLDTNGLLNSSSQKDERKRVLILPEEEEGEEIPFSKKPDAKVVDSYEHVKMKNNIMNTNRPMFRPCDTDSSLSQNESSFNTSQMSTSSMSTSMSIWQDQSSLSGQAGPQLSLNRGSISVDSVSGFAPAVAPSNQHSCFNPYLPVHAERMLMNLGFVGPHGILPERFLKDWYRKMAQAELESQQMMQDSRADFHRPPDRAVVRGNSFVKPKLIPSLRSSAGLAANQCPEGYVQYVMDAQADKHGQTSTWPDDTDSNVKRNQWANAKVKSSSLCLDTLDADDTRLRINSFNHQFSGIRPSKTPSILKSKNISARLPIGSRYNVETNSENSIIYEQSFSLPVPEIRCEDINSKDSLEVADIFHNHENKKDSSLLEPAIMSSVLKAVDDTTPDGTARNMAAHHADVSDGFLNIPVSRSSSMSNSPIPPSPITVIEVSLDNQHDSIDMEEATSASSDHTRCKVSFEIDTLKPESNAEAKVSLKGDVSDNISLHVAAAEIGHGSKNEMKRPVKSQSVSVQADDGQLSPIVCFPLAGDVSARSEEYEGDDQFTECGRENKQTTPVPGVETTDLQTGCIQSGTGMAVINTVEIGGGGVVQLLEENADSPRERENSLTDDWVISQFRFMKASNQLDCNASSHTSCHKKVMQDTVSPREAKDNIKSDLVESEPSKLDLAGVNDDGSPVTKLDIFASTFLAEAEKYCNVNRSDSDTIVNEENRAHVLLSSPFGNGSSVTQSTCIHSSSSGFNIPIEDVDEPYDESFTKLSAHRTCSAERHSIERCVRGINSDDDIIVTESNTSRKVSAEIDPQKGDSVYALSPRVVPSGQSIHKYCLEEGDGRIISSWAFFCTTVSSEDLIHDYVDLDPKSLGQIGLIDVCSSPGCARTGPTHEADSDGASSSGIDVCRQMIDDEADVKQDDYSCLMTTDEKKQKEDILDSVSSTQDEQDTFDICNASPPPEDVWNKIISKIGGCLSEEAKELDSGLKDEVPLNECLNRTQSGNQMLSCFRRQLSYDSYSSFVEDSHGSANPDLKRNSSMNGTCQERSLKIDEFATEAYAKLGMAEFTSHQSEYVTSPFGSFDEENSYNVINPDQIIHTVHVLDQDLNSIVEAVAKSPVYQVTSDEKDKTKTNGFIRCSPVSQQSPISVSQVRPTTQISNNNINLWLNEENSFKPIHYPKCTDHLLHPNSHSNGNTTLRDNRVFSDYEFTEKHKSLHYNNRPNTYFQNVSNCPKRTRSTKKRSRHSLLFKNQDSINKLLSRLESSASGSEDLIDLNFSSTFSPSSPELSPVSSNYTHSRSRNIFREEHLKTSKACIIATPPEHYCLSFSDIEFPILTYINTSKNGSSETSPFSLSVDESAKFQDQFPQSKNKSDDDVQQASRSRHYVSATEKETFVDLDAFYASSHIESKPSPCRYEHATPEEPYVGGAEIGRRVPAFSVHDGDGEKFLDESDNDPFRTEPTRYQRNEITHDSAVKNVDFPTQYKPFNSKFRSPILSCGSQHMPYSVQNETESLTNYSSKDGYQSIASAPVICCNSPPNMNEQLANEEGLVHNAHIKSVISEPVLPSVVNDEPFELLPSDCFANKRKARMSVLNMEATSTRDRPATANSYSQTESSWSQDIADFHYVQKVNRVLRSIELRIKPLENAIGIPSSAMNKDSSPTISS